MELLISLILFLLSIAAIGKGSDWLTDSLIPLARKLGVTGAAVGLILVSAAVSLPEIMVATYAMLKGYTTISLGVILGSIIANIGLMTGLSALVRPLKVSINTILRDGVFSLVVPILVFAISAGGQITRIEGFAFFLLFIAYVINVFLLERQNTDEQKQKLQQTIEKELELVGFELDRLKPGWLTFCLGVLFLIAGTQLFSNQLVSVVTRFGVNELLVGLTLGAIGPSIPNIVAAYTATRKGMDEIAISETFGSNIFTLLVTLGIVAMLSPVVISSQWLNFDIPVLIGMSFLLFFFAVTRQKIDKREGWVLLGSYLTILVVQVFLTNSV